MFENVLDRHQSAILDLKCIILYVRSVPYHFRVPIIVFIYCIMEMSFGDIDSDNSIDDAELLVASFESDVLDTEAIVVEGRLGSNMPEDVLQEPAEDNEPILAVQGLQQEDDLLLDAKEEPVEDNPPTLAVQGFRPSDYTYDAFSIGMRLRWAISKTDSWNDGIVTGVRLLPVHTCELDVTRLGNHPPGTVTKLTFPSDVHEISIVHPPKHFMLSINDLRPGYHIAFNFHSDYVNKRFCDLRTGVGGR